MPESVSLCLDANLLLLLVVGTTNRALIGRYKRTQMFTVHDYDLVLEIIGRSRELVTTIHVLVEVSNLAGALYGETREKVFAALRILAVDRLDEQDVDTHAALNDSSFVRLGLTDAALATLAAEGVTLLTTDVALYLEVTRRGGSAENYNHLRFSA